MAHFDIGKLGKALFRLIRKDDWGNEAIGKEQEINKEKVKKQKQKKT